MPTYSFRNKDTGEVFDKIMKMSELSSFLSANPLFETYFSQAPSLGDSVRLGIRKPDGGFNEVLSKIHSNNYKSNLADKLSRK